MDKKRLHLLITGVVQGVCFRLYTQREAQKLGLLGWVRNVRDGSVELVAEGAEQPLRDLAAWCEQGPPSADVTHTEPQWTQATGEFPSFEITG